MAHQRYGGEHRPHVNPSGQGSKPPQ